MDNKSGKHLYSRGWFGLIPLIGGITGIGLIILGVFKYRDRKLTIIGIAALSFTVLVYSSMIYYFSFSKQARKDFAAFDQPAMNHLIKAIEFYKVEHGTYPENLKQLVKEDELTNIYDRMPGNSKTNNGEFYYKKLSNKYYLFSAGIDNTPFTPDDIFPSSNFYDSTKTGLVQPFQ